MAGGRCCAAGWVRLMRGALVEDGWAGCCVAGVVLPLVDGVDVDDVSGGVELGSCVLESVDG